MKISRGSQNSSGEIGNRIERKIFILLPWTVDSSPAMAGLGPPLDFASSMVCLFSKLANPRIINALMEADVHHEEARVSSTILGHRMTQNDGLHMNSCEDGSTMVQQYQHPHMWTVVTQDQTLLRQELQDSVVHRINAGITPSVTNHGTAPNAPDPPLGGVGDHTGNLAPLPSYSSSNYMQSPCQASFVQATKAKHGKQMMEIVGQNPKN